MRIRTLTVLLAGIALAVPAAAVDRGFYVGGGLGFPSFQAGDFYPEYGDLRFEENTLGFKVFGGYRIFTNLSVEAAYTDYATFTRRETGVTGAHQKLDVGIQAWDVSAVGVLPLGPKVDAFARLGYAAWNADVEFTLDDPRDPSNNVDEDRGQDGTDLSWGFGLDFRFDKFGVRVEGDWQEIEDTGGAFLVLLALTYRF